MTNAIPTMLIAPCGMNCRLCRAFTRDKKPCPGCRGDDSLKSPYCVTCRIANCDRFTEGGAKYCFDCDVYPCPRLKHLDKRYRTNYAMSMIANLNDIQQHGVRQFIRNEKKKWTCPECGELLSVHKPKCLSCGHPWR
ncbi:MAG: DUF3795 domain-containing protein [Proteobacteria bacterium]|nr:DUF3795 domain-containing protein [Pseudomonadota bacterium]